MVYMIDVDMIVFERLAWALVVSEVIAIKRILKRSLNSKIVVLPIKCDTSLYIITIIFSRIHIHFRRTIMF